MARLITRPATKLVAGHDRYADHHTLTERAADRERRVLSMKARKGLAAGDRKILGEAAIESAAPCTRNATISPRNRARRWRPQA